MDAAAAIESHYVRRWGPVEGRFALGVGPARHVRELQGLDVLRFTKTDGVAVFATRGMTPAGATETLEVHVLARPSDAERDAFSLVELLSVVAHYHRTGARLGLGHTFDIGRAWLPRATCTYGLLSLPYLDGPALEWLETPRTRFLWLIPITAAERAFKVAHGLDALEERFEQTLFDYLDPARPSVC